MNDEDAPEADADGSPASRSNPGPEWFRATAQEVISAVRGVLDVAENLLDDPRTAEAVGATFAAFERAAGRATAAARHTDRKVDDQAGDDEAGDDSGDDGGGSSVQRIPVS